MKEPSYNLPLQLTSFIGRERETAEVKRLLASTRLLTLTGSGGAGKTRLAIQVATEMRDSFPNGVWFVDLAPLSDATLVPQTVATVFGLQEQGSRPIANALRDYLCEKHLLLLLDNCEHLINACARFVDEVLRTAPQVSILATSREALSIAGETTFRAPSLSVPDVKNSPPLESVAQSDAVCLFVARATAVRSDFALSEQNVRTIAQICHRLDGMPLAIELAAARVKALSIDVIAARLDDRFNLLNRGSRVALPRQQTLRATMDWSYDLLSEPERILLRRLSVFSGGWTLQAAESICAGNGIASSDVLDRLTHLVDKSLVIVEEQNAQTRYRMLETIRQYAHEKLIEFGELNAARDRHLNYFVEWAEMAEPHLHGPEELSWLNRLETNNDNLRAALEWSIENQNARAEDGMRLAGALKWFWWLNGNYGEGCVWFNRVLASSSTFPVSKAARAKALAGVGWLSSWDNKLEAAVTLSEESLNLYRERGDPRGIGIALCNLANAALHHEDYTKAAMLGEEAAAFLEKAGDQVHLCVTLGVLGDIAKRQVDYTKAIRYYQESLALIRALGADMSSIFVLLQLGTAFEGDGDYAAAKQLFQEGLVHAREVNSKLYVGIALNLLGEVALHEGQYGQAVKLCEENLSFDLEWGRKDGQSWTSDLLAIAACRMLEYPKAVVLFKQALLVNTELDYKQGIAENLAGLSAVLVELGHLESAARLCGATEALLELVGANLGPADREEYHRTVGTLLAKLEEATFNKLQAEGRAMTKEQAIDYVSSLSFTRLGLEQPHLLPRQEAKQAFGGLTPREREVATLIARGKSNRDIASELVLSERTVEHHVGNMLSKLELHSRSQLAAWVMEKGLYKQ